MALKENRPVSCSLGGDCGSSLISRSPISCMGLSLISRSPISCMGLSLISRSPISCMGLSASIRFGGLSSFGVLSLARWLLLSPYCLTSLLYTHDVYPYRYRITFPPFARGGPCIHGGVPYSREYGDPGVPIFTGCVYFYDTGTKRPDVRYIYTDSKTIVLTRWASLRLAPISYGQPAQLAS